MNARTSLVTATLTLALIAPAAANAASLNVPCVSTSSSCASSSSKPAVSLRHLLKASPGHREQRARSATAIRVGAYDAYAYVHGGASQKLARAITAAGKSRAGDVCVSAVPRRVPC